MKSFVIALILSACLASVSAQVTSDVPIILCPEVSSQNIDFTTISINPFPLQKGKKADFSIAGTAKAAINQKYIGLAVYQSGKNIYNTSIGGPSTTGAGGNYQYSLSYGLPSVVPSGTYDLHFSIVDGNKKAQACFVVTAKF